MLYEVITNDLPTPSIDITATERVVFLTQSSGTIGTLANRLDIVSPIIDYLNLTGEDIIATSAYIEIQGDSEINDGQPLVIDNAVRNNFV